jgi:tRNA 2-(methylsulfanyl)-N6-isopentenyladenosine37 hydroxylase
VILSATSSEWVRVATANVNAVLADHAHCEKKAAASALSLIAAYPSDDELVRRMSALAVEELQHFRAVHERLLARGGSLGRDEGDPYAKRLLSLARPNQGRLVDRLLLLGLIEARSRERLHILGEHLIESDGALEPDTGGNGSSNGDGDLARFYRQLAEAEGRHAEMFRELACRYAPEAVVAERLRTLAIAEAGIVASLPVLPRIH